MKLTNEEIIKQLNLPEDFIPCCAITLGKTNEEYNEKDIPERISRSYIK